MSTIEEARAQARDTLADYHRVNAGGYGAGHHASLARALRVLLDATEPPEAQEAAEPMRDADGDMISSGEHRKISMSGGSFFVCDTCTNVLGLNVRWDHASKREDHQAAVEPLPIKPAEDERATLEQAIGYELVPLSIRNHPEIRYEYRTADDRDGLVDRIIASDFRKGPRPITDEMVEAGVHAAWSKRTVGIGGQVVYGPSPEMYRMVRVALEAAEEARR